MYMSIHIYIDIYKEERRYLELLGDARGVRAPGRRHQEHQAVTRPRGRAAVPVRCSGCLDLRARGGVDS